MNAHVQRKGFRDVYEIYLFEPNGISGGSRVYQCHGADEWSFEDIGTLEPFDKPTLVLNSQMLEAIVAAAQDILPPSAAVERHLNDTITLRDRLLTLVEKERG